MKNFIVVLFAALLCGCVQVKTEKQKMTMGIPHGKVKYAPVKATGLELKIFGKTTFRAGRPAVLTFALANNGTSKVTVPEWFSHEPDNIGILIQPWLPGMTEPDEKKWMLMVFDFKKPIMHYPVTLMPGNQVLVSKKLDVVEKMMIKPGEECRFFIKAELTLESLKLSSSVIMIKVQPNVQTVK